VHVACEAEILREVPLFALLDDEELAVLAAQVDLTRFTPRQRIYRIGDPGGRAYVLISGRVRVTTIDEDQQDVIVDEPASGDFFGFASMLDQSAHQTNAVAVDEAVCVEVDRDDIETLIQRRPHAAMDMLTVLGRQIHAAQQLVRVRAARNPNELIEEQATFGERVADGVAGFGGSWTFIITFLVGLLVYSAINVVLKGRAWDPYPFILLNLILSMLAALQAPVIMMSQIRQDTKDRLRGELDFAVNRRAEAEVQALSQKLNAIIDKIDDLDQSVHRRLG
jgi:CRP/FNR family cyclic AMP-dependent transcriptional regulator